MNVMGTSQSDWYERLPSPPAAILGYFVLVTAAYFATMWRAARLLQVSSAGKEVG